MSDIPGLVDDLIGGLLGDIGRVVDLLFRLVRETAHCLADFPVSVFENLSGSVGEPFSTLFEETARTPGIHSNAAPHFVARLRRKHDRSSHTDPEAGQQRHKASSFSHLCELLCWGPLW